MIERERHYPLPPAVQLISHLSEGAYTSFAKAIRELVSNSFDARATEVSIEFSPDFGTLTVHDNGDGISADEFKELFMRISGSTRRLFGGRDRGSGRPIIGLYGIGVLAIAPICAEAVIRSKKRGVRGGIVRTIPLAHLFSDELQRENLNENYFYHEDECFEDTEDAHYTTIELRGLRNDIRQDLARPGTGAPDWTDVDQLAGLDAFRWELGILAPVKYEPGCPVARRVGVIQRAWGELDSFRFRVRVNGEELLKPVRLGRRYNDTAKWNYNEEALPERLYDVMELQSENDDPVQYYGYLYDQTKQIHPAALRGVLLRINHVGIKGYSKSLLEFTRSNIGPTIFSISGEVFITAGLEDALSMDKDDFKEQHPNYRFLVGRIHDAIEEIRTKARARSARLRGRVERIPHRRVRNLRVATPTLQQARRALGPRAWAFMLAWQRNPPISSFVKTLGRRIAVLNTAGATTEEMSYLLEALKCFEQECYRASVVLVWNAAMHRVHLRIEANGFQAFDQAAQAVIAGRLLPWYRQPPHASTTLDEFKEKVTDAHVIGGLLGLNWIDLPVCKTMYAMLTLRHNCAHPTTYALTDGESIATFTFLLKNVFENPNLR